MAAPHHLTLRNMNGEFKNHKASTEEIDQLLKFQGVNWATRKLMKMAPIKVRCISSVDQSGNTQITIQNMLPVGISTSDIYIFDDEPREKNGMELRCRFLPLDDVNDEFLREGFEDGTEEVVSCTAYKNKDEVAVEEVWGFQIYEGERYWVKKSIIKGDVDFKMRLIHSYCGAVDAEAMKEVQ